MATTEEMQGIALRLLELGYTPLRIDPDSKAARNPGWQVETPTEESLRRAFARTSNMGVRCGDMHRDNTCLVGIDVDLEDGDLIRCVQRAIGDDAVPTKQGKKGATFLVRMDREVKTTKIKWVRDKKKIDAIDILAKGAQTVIPPSIHPDTKLPYRWIAGQPLWEVDYRTLPVFGPSLLDEIRGFCSNPDDPIYALNDMEWRGVGGGGNTHDVCVRAVSSMVARKWTDEDIHQRIQRAKREAAEASGMPYNWPEAQKVIQEWIDSSRDKKFDTTAKQKIDDIPLEILNRYVYVISVNQLYDLKKNVMVDMNVFNNVHARDMGKPWASLMLHPDLRMVDRVTYSPGQPQFCKERSFDSDAVMDCLNIYSPADIHPEEGGEVAPFLDLVDHVFDKDPAAVAHFLSFFAYAMQNPGARINHALVIQGEQGIGKDSLLLAIERAMGKHNCAQVTLQHVESQFNDWLFGKQLITFQEMLATGRRGIYNKLKTYITDPIHTINIKHTKLQRIPNRSVYVFLTNYQHALSLDRGDRRMWVWYSSAHPLTPAYYQRYYDWMSDDRNIAALHHWFLHYDCSKFRPGAPPPITEAKRKLIEASASEVEQYLRGAAEAQTWPMACDLISVQHLAGAIRSTMRASISMINEAIDNIVGDTFELRPRIGATRPRLRVIRNLDQWKSLGPDQAHAKAAAEYRMPLPPGPGETEGTYQVYNGADMGGDSAQDPY